MSFFTCPRSVASWSRQGRPRLIDSIADRCTRLSCTVHPGSSVWRFHSLSRRSSPRSRSRSRPLRAGRRALDRSRRHVSTRTADPHHGVIGALLDHDVGELAGREDVLVEVHPVDRRPTPAGRTTSAWSSENAGELAVERVAAAPEHEEPVDEPLLDVGLGGVDVDADVDRVRRARAGAVPRR